MEIKRLRKRDYGKAIDFAITGMHFNWYTDSRFQQRLYGRYFWYLEMTTATQVLAAYEEGRLAGVLLARMKGENRICRSLWMHIYIKFFELMSRFFIGNGADSYDEANQRMLEAYRKQKQPDGEITFLAADPNLGKRGIGTALLRAFEAGEQGKTVYLYTDNACTYQFYEHRGFSREGQEDILLDLGKRQVELQCFLYHRKIL
ncbi:MAG: GNAT family N-acetyltransferase [Eubacteriales bacterium]|nr:GNAT family N-acetyltransferase [Eubacteriales bacterium]